MMDEEITNFLKDGEKTSTQIQNYLNRNWYDTLSILEKLKQQKKLIKIRAGKYTLWKLKNDKRIKQ